MPKTEKQNEAIRVARKAAILDSALHVFAEQGYHSASISQVSSHAKISKGLLYNYFESKAELLQELLSSIMNEEVKIIKSIISAPLTDERIKALIHQTFQLIASDPQHWKLYFMMSIQSDVLKVIMSQHAELYQTFHLQFSAYFSSSYGEEWQMQLQYFNTVFSGMKLSYVLDPEHYPIEEMKNKLITQFVK